MCRKSTTYFPVGPASLPLMGLIERPVIAVRAAGRLYTSLQSEF